MDAIIEWLKPLNTSMIIRYITDLDPLHNPWIIGATVVFVLVSLWLKWYLLLSCTLTLTGFIALVWLVQNIGTDLEHSSDRLFVFVGGGAALVFLFIYMVFMRSD